MSDSRDNASFLWQQFLVPLGSLIVGGGLAVHLADFILLPILSWHGRGAQALRAPTGCGAAGLTLSG